MTMSCTEFIDSVRFPDDKIDFYSYYKKWVRENAVPLAVAFEAKKRRRRGEKPNSPISRNAKKKKKKKKKKGKKTVVEFPVARKEEVNLFDSIRRISTFETGKTRILRVDELSVFDFYNSTEFNIPTYPYWFPADEKLMGEYLRDIGVRGGGSLDRLVEYQPGVRG